MGKMKLLKIVTIVLFLSFQGCIGVVPVPVPPPDGQPGVVYDPPPLVFPGPPDVIAMPETDDVYVVPDIEADLYFWNGWWWRPWEGRWYRSLFYNRGWVHYTDVPAFYFDVDPGWRGHYRGRTWYGHRWDYERIPHQRLQQNWRNWQKDHHWERQGSWGVRNYQPRPQHQRQELRQQRQHQYQQRPEFRQPPRQPEVQPPPQRQHEAPPQWRQPEAPPSHRQPEARQPQRQPDVRPPQRQPEVQPPQRQPDIQQPQKQPPEKVQPPQKQTGLQKPQKPPEVQQQPRQPGVQPSQKQPAVKQPQKPSEEKTQQPQPSPSQGKPEPGEKERQDRK